MVTLRSATRLALVGPFIALAACGSDAASGKLFDPGAPADDASTGTPPDSEDAGWPADDASTGTPPDSEDAGWPADDASTGTPPDAETRASSTTRTPCSARSTTATNGRDSARMHPTMQRCPAIHAHWLRPV